MALKDWNIRFKNREMVGIIDYGMGNILSVKNALEMIGVDARICVIPEEVRLMDKIILPGVGSFRDCIQNLRLRGFVDVLNEVVMKQAKPILGICLGMQVMARKGFEGGEYNGFGWFDADVIRLTSEDLKLRIPHIGWNNIEFVKESFLFKGLPFSPDVYFVHSYYMNCRDKNDVIGVFDYGGFFTAAVQKNNIVATQFHPEKSQDHGIKMLKNFLSWNP
jgi:glutamine amidotransferase